MDSKKMREYKYIRNTLPISNRYMNGENLVEFSIDSKQYDFEEGMTWRDWVNSAFNTENAVISGGWVNFSTFVLMDSDDPVDPDDLIKENYTYIPKDKEPSN